MIDISTLGLNTLDYVILVVFLAFIVFIGLMAAKLAGNTKEGLLVAGRKVGLWTMVATLVAGEFGAITMVYMGQAGYLNGIAAMFLGWYVLIGWNGAAILGFGSVWFRRMKIMTVPEIIELRYGRGARAICGFAMALAFMVILGSFLSGLAHLFSVFFNVSPNVMLVVMLIVALIYTITGGMWASVLTDVVQFVFLGVAIPVCAILAIRAAGGWETMYAKVVEIGGRPFVDGYAQYGFMTTIYQIWWFFAAALCYPTALSRALSARSVRVAYKGNALGTSTFLARAVFPTLVGAAGLCLLPNMGNSMQVYGYTMLATLPHGLIGLMVAGLIAAFMSTADTYYLTCASMIPQDIITPLLKKGKSLTDKQTVLLVRLGICLTATVALFVGFFYQGGMIYWFIKLGELMFVSGLAICVLFGMYWKKANQVGAIACLATGLIVTILTNYVFEMQAWVCAFLAFGLATVAMIIGSLASQQNDPPKQILGVKREVEALVNGVD